MTLTAPPSPPRAPRTRHLTFIALLTLSALLVVGGGLACNELAGLLGPTGEKVVCDLTGTAVGFDGGEVKKLDVNWYPEESAGTSDTIEGEVEGNAFHVTALTVPQGATRAVGQLAVGEAPTPPLPLKYGQVRIDIDLPLGECQMDLGEIQLPAKGSADDQTDEPTNNDTGTNNGGTDNAGTNNGAATNNATNNATNGATDNGNTGG